MIGRQLINYGGNLGTNGGASGWCCAARGGGQRSRLRDGCDRVVVGILFIPLFQDVVNCLVGISVLAGFAAKCQRSEAAAISCMDERLEGRI